MTDRQTLLDLLHQLSAEILDGEQHAGHLKHIGASMHERVQVEADVAFLRREHRTYILEGYFLNTGSVVPDYSDPAPLRAVRDRLKKRVADEQGS